MKQEVASLSNFVQQVSAELHEWVSVCLFFFPWPYSVKASLCRKRDGQFKFGLPCSTCLCMDVAGDSRACVCASLINVPVNNETSTVTRGSPSH